MCFPSVKSVASLSLRAAGVPAGFRAAAKTAPGEILSCKDQETLCSRVCVSLPGLFPDIIIKGDICVTELFFSQVSGCVWFDIGTLT